jgi:Nickel responsive protein SCO4226-like
MAHFLVERYLPGLSEEALRGDLARLAPATSGTAVRYICSTIVVEDESCLCHFEAPSAAAVAEVNQRANMPLDRIVPALPVAPATG